MLTGLKYLFKEGRAIHDEYINVPEEYGLTEEIDAFQEKSQADIADMKEAIELQKELTGK